MAAIRLLSTGSGKGSGRVRWCEVEPAGPVDPVHQHDRDDADGDEPELSLSALRHIRGSILGSRWIVVPDSATLAQANSRIAELMAVQDFKERGDRALSAAQHLELLEKDFTPFALGSTLAVLLFIGWVSSLFILAWFGISKDGKIYWPRFVGIGVVSICLLASWLVTLWLL